MPAEVESHWLAAQEAQEHKDYRAAEKEYRVIISLAPHIAEAYLNLGLIYQLQERWPDAMKMFRKALDLKSSLTGASFFLGIDYCRQGEGKLAVPHLKDAVRAKPDLPEAWSWLATAQEMMGQTEDEIRTLRAGLKLHPRNVDLLYLLGHAYEQLGKDAIDRTQATSPGSAYVQQLLGESYAATGYYSAALVHFQNATALTPRRPGLHLGMAEIFLRNGRLQQAQAELDTELQLDPASLRALVRRGEVRILEGDVDGALADWSRALGTSRARTEAILGLRELGFGEASQELLPAGLHQKLAGLRERLKQQSGAAAQLAMAFVAAQKGKPSSILPGLEAGNSPAVPSSADCTDRSLQQMVRKGQLESIATCGPLVLTPRSFLTLRLQIARALSETNRPEMALEALQGLTPSQANNPEVLYWKSRSYKHLALATYLRLYQVAPDSYRVHELLADLHVAREEDSQAIQEYRLALARKPDLPNLHYEIGHLLWKGYKVAEAREELQAELRLNPRHVGALLDMGTTYLYEHQPQEALPYLRKVQELDPGNPSIHNFLGTAYAQLGLHAQAEKELKLAAASDRDGKIHYQLGKLYQEQGRKQEAAKQFAISTRLNSESHRKNEERVRRLGAADVALKQP